MLASELEEDDKPMLIILVNGCNLFFKNKMTMSSAATHRHSLVLV
jgi:hypothetical protein